MTALRTALATTALVCLALVLIACAPAGPTQAPPAGSPASGRPATRTVETTEPAMAPIPLAETVLPVPRRVYPGAYSPPAPFEGNTVERLETDSGRSLSIVMWYQPWARGNRSRFDTGTVVSVWRAGKVPMITWEPWDPGNNAAALEEPAEQPAYRLKEIIDGRYDDYIRSWALGIKESGGPVMLRPMQEMNGFWYPWAGTANGNRPPEYVQAWRHIHDIFESVGADNVTWVWSINHETVPNTKANSYAAYYPGDEYVDWVAVSGFNWGTTTPYSDWGTFSRRFDTPLAYLKTLDKPICIAEFGSVEQGGNKARWITDAYRQIASDRTIGAAIYYDALEQGATRQDWRISTSAGSTEAFGKSVAISRFTTGTPPALTQWVERLEPRQWLYLASIEPLY